MKTWTLHPDEWYPVLQLNRYRDGNTDGRMEAEFSDEEIAELRALEQKFNELQRKIAARFGLAEHPFAQFDRTLVYEAPPHD
ncbi:MAG: hypothetical protein WAN04_14920 [Candidatus Udaeobacter sp.]